IFVSSSSLPDFGYVPITTSSITKDYTVWGHGLKAAIDITMPPGFTKEIVNPNPLSPLPPLTPIGGIVPPTLIHVTFSPTEGKTYNGVITNSSAGAVTQNVAVNGWSCADIFFEATGDLPGDCYFSYGTDISKDGERVSLNSYSKDPTLPASGGACEATSSGNTYDHPYQAGGWTSPCKDIRFFPSSTNSGLIGFGYVTGGSHLETTAQGISPDGKMVVGYTTYGSGYPDLTKGIVISSIGTTTLNYLPGDKESVAQDASEGSPLIGPPSIPPTIGRRIIVGYSYTRYHEPSIDSFAHAVYWDNLNSSGPNFIHALPLPENNLLPNNEKIVSSEALCVSDDGTIIGGNLFYSKKTDGTHFNAVP
ncbi:MAG TPA: hypothetical protein VJ508_02290, partial [Saprospiraceae bacterium]|nr:hypothetical protein [Saprospiraceae bacterium]